MRTALIAGASFAGLCTAYWLKQLNYEVTVVEISKDLKRGGTPVNIMGDTIGIMKQMGLFQKIKEQALPMKGMSFVNSAGDIVGTMPREENEEYEIERDTLLEMLYDLVRSDVLFGTNMNDIGSAYDLIVGCDGVHSAVRKRYFGPESDYVKYLGVHFSISIVPELLIPEFTTEMYQESGKTIMLNAYNGKTDICFCFRSNEIAYDHRNEPQMRELIAHTFTNVGWRSQELLERIEQAESFYFDKLCQTHMPSWSKGNVVLVGDAAYCPSPAAGRGGSLAIDGAYALYQALLKNDLNSYENFRPFIDRIQAEVLEDSLPMLVRP